MAQFYPAKALHILGRNYHLLSKLLKDFETKLYKFFFKPLDNLLKKIK